MKKNIIIIFIAVVLILFLAYLMYQSATPRNVASAPEVISFSATHSSVPSDMAVPDKTTASVPQGLALPSAVSQAGPSSVASARTFDLKIENNRFTPETMAVYLGDTVHINISAIDRDYDFVQPDYGLKMLIPKGTKKVVEFQAVTSGSFTSYCEKCGGPSKGPVGYVVVVPKQ